MLQVAERLLREGTSSADPAQGVRHLRAALALWHGQSLADVTGVAWLEEQAVRLDLLCLQVKRALQVATERAAADAARRDGDLRGRGHALFSLAEACERLNRLEEAESHYRGALEAFAAAGDLSGEADVCLGMAELAAHQDRLADALAYSRRALDTFRLADDAIGQAIALSNVGGSHALLGEYHQALTFSQDALVLLQELGLREGEASHLEQPGLRPPRASRPSAGRDLLPAFSRPVPRTRRPLLRGRRPHPSR